ncbi:MAG: SPOR domain-containing protein [Bacteroidota bacterium]
MIVEKYIKKLLDERKRVVLPGFGNLEIKETGGGMPTSGGRIDPPGLSVKFDTGYSKDDGLLASVAASGEKMDAEEAGQQVLELVDAVKFALDKGESYGIPETGTFTRNEDGKIYFNVDPGWVLEPDQYGLESMDLLELEELPVKEKKAPAVKKPAKEPSEKPSASGTKTKPEAVKAEKIVAKTSKPLTELHPPEERPRKLNRWRVVWYVAGALIVLLIALIFIPVDSIRKPKQKEPVVTGTEEIETEQPAITNDQAAEDQQNLEEQIIENANAEAATITEEPQPVVEKHNYFIVAGSFKHLQYASDLQDQLKARGYQAEVLITEDRMYRVSVASYATKDEAERALARVKADQGLQSCWLLSN